MMEFHFFLCCFKVVKVNTAVFMLFDHKLLWPLVITTYGQFYTEKSDLQSAFWQKTEKDIKMILWFVVVTVVR